MRKRRVYALVAGLVAVAAVALMLVFVVIPSGAESMKNPEASTQKVAAALGSPAEGIAVHGHWTIEVRNPDGSLVTHHEFDNALTAGGKSILTSILARERTPGKWFIAFRGSPNPCMVDSNPDMCFLCEAGDPHAGQSNYFSNLTVTRVGTGDTAKLILSGSATIANTSNIYEVFSELRYCDGTVSPADCATTPARPVAEYEQTVTGTNLSSRIAVTAGQSVQVIVEISFS